MNLVVLIPTYNERGNVGKLLDRVELVLARVRGWPWQILVVDDNSPDGTADIVRRKVLQSRRIKLLLRKKKTGLGAAYLAGLRQAFEKMGADAVIIMDADLSHQPKYIPFFLSKIEEGADFVVGSRYVEGGSIASGWVLHRKLLSVFGNKITSLVLGRGDFSDWTSGYRMIRREVFAKVGFKLSGFRGYTFNIAFAYYSALAGCRVAEVPIRFVDRTQGSSKLGFEYLFHTPLFLVKIRLKMLLGSIV